MPPIVIVGAGIGGLSTAIALKRKLGLGANDFTIYEKASDVGGTWRDNIYPGASSDVAVHFYSLSTDLNPDWPSTHASQPEMLDYLRKLARKYELYPQIAFNRLVVSATWSAAEQVYHVVTEDVVSRKRSSTTAKILVSALGLLETPHTPEIAGLGSFKGEMFHSARWDTGADLRGKRVAVIGNGASATQFIPLITQDSTVHVTQFCRTPNWFLPPIRADYSPLWRWTFRNVPLAMRLYRLYLYLRTESLYMFVFANKTMRSKFAVLAKDYIVKTAPKADVDRLIPSYSLGCKRIIFDTNFLEALHRPNLDLNWDGIQHVVKDGIVTKTGERLPFDAIILATGFTTDRYPLTVVGSEGTTVQEYYDTQGGPKAYLGTTVPGFPNFFILGGPNTATGHTSVILTEEIQIDYILALSAPLLSGALSALSPTPRATDAYNALLQSRLAHSVFVGCTSWYRTGGGAGRVTGIFPGSMMLYRCWLRAPRWQDYNVFAPPAAAAKWEKGLRREKWMGWVSPVQWLARLAEVLVLGMGG
ncbi:hypothetical protein B0H15DRAFT_869258 [Mycena belliarum]|uniref:Uncharacterized protein n=1 Tax=Mycena belliarum TaxID=1033014 RepID=A0AAD6TPK4_9AGAR|nr:hypothetical protein B0H15DRAFT_869258 [Mycena belliae]